MRLPRQRWANCYFFLCYALMRGRIGHVAAVSTLGGWFPWHLVALSHRGHALHFRATLAHEENALAPWWFLGSTEGVRRSRLEAALEESGRTLCWKVRAGRRLAALAGGFGLVLLLPWVVAWAVWPVAWLASSIAEAFAHRWRTPQRPRPVSSGLQLYRPSPGTRRQGAEPASFGPIRTAQAA